MYIENWIGVNKKQMLKLTPTELRNLRYILRSQIDWQEGGCFGDGDKITDKRGYSSAQKILGKIDIEIDSLI